MIKKTSGGWVKIRSMNPSGRNALENKGSFGLREYFFSQSYFYFSRDIESRHNLYIKIESNFGYSSGESTLEEEELHFKRIDKHLLLSISFLKMFINEVYVPTYL